MTVDPEAIKLVLEQSTVPKASELDPKRFYDNSLIREVNRDYGSKLFPSEIRLNLPAPRSMKTTLRFFSAFFSKQTDLSTTDGFCYCLASAGLQLRRFVYAYY